MIVLLITLGIIAFLLLVLIVPVFLTASFDGGLLIKVRVMFIPFTLYPRPPKPEKKLIKKSEKKAKKEEKKEISRSEELLREEGITAVLSYYKEMARLLGTAAKRLLRTITVDRLRLNIVVASDDASQTAVHYGRVCAVIYPIQALMESAIRIRRRNITIKPDFMQEKARVEGAIHLHVIPVRALWVLLLFFIGYLGNTTTAKVVKQ